MRYFKGFNGVYYTETELISAYSIVVGVSITAEEIDISHFFGIEKEIPDAELEVKDFLKAHQKVKAVKYYKETFGIESLLEAKHAVDEIEEKMRENGEL